MEPYQMLEQEFAAWTGVPDTVACASGTAALHLALESLHLPAGSEVIVPDFSMIAIPRAVTLAGLTPVFVDCCPHDLALDPSLLKKALDPSTTALIVMHAYGHVAPLTTIHKVLEEYTQGVSHGLPVMVIEDLAEAHGVRPHPKSAAACWSFYRNKIVHGEEGGACFFKDVEASARARCLRSLGFKDGHDFNHHPRGHNYRLSNLHAQAVRRSLANVEPTWDVRRRNESILAATVPSGMAVRFAPWVYDVRRPWMTPKHQEAVVRNLQSLGVAARHAFKPATTQDEYRHFAAYTGERWEALDASRQVFYVPLDMTAPMTQKAAAYLEKVDLDAAKGIYPSPGCL